MAVRLDAPEDEMAREEDDGTTFLTGDGENHRGSAIAVFA